MFNENPFNGEENVVHKSPSVLGEMTKGLLGVAKIVAVFVVALILFSMFTYIVDETEHAIVSRFSRISTVVVNNLNDEQVAHLVNNERYADIDVHSGAGLYFKIPFIDVVEYQDNRLITYNTAPREIITQDTKKLILDNNAQWWIVDPVAFKVTMGTQAAANQRIEDQMYSKINEKVGLTNSLQLISDKEYVIGMLAEVADDLNLTFIEYGVTIADVQIRKTDLPEENSQNIYNRMKTEREQMAKQYRSEGLEEAAIIRSDADREAEELQAVAFSEAETIKGEGDAEAARIYNEAYSKDPQFFDFYRSIETYKTTIDEDTTIVIEPDSEFADILLNDGLNWALPTAVPTPPTTVVEPTE